MTPLRRATVPRAGNKKEPHEITEDDRPSCCGLAGRGHRGGACVDARSGSSRSERERNGRSWVTGQATPLHQAILEARSHCSDFAFGNYPWPLALDVVEPAHRRSIFGEQTESALVSSPIPSLIGITMTDGINKTNGITMTNAVIECILSRNATKYFDPAATLSDDQIRELVRIGTTAPTSFHLQNWRFIAVRTPEAKARLRPIAWDQPAITEAAVTSSSAVSWPIPA
jgi:nitroreductase family protein